MTGLCDLLKDVDAFLEKPVHMVFISSLEELEGLSVQQKGDSADVEAMIRSGLDIRNF